MARRKRYSAAFKREALRRADEPGVTDVLVAEELGINARHAGCADRHSAYGIFRREVKTL
jgi:hypothetical protein